MAWYNTLKNQAHPTHHITLKKKTNLLLSAADNAKSSRATFHRFCLTSSNCFWEDAEMLRLKSNCKSKRLASHEILIGDDKSYQQKSLFPSTKTILNEF